MPSPGTGNSTDGALREHYYGSAAMCSDRLYGSAGNSTTTTPTDAEFELGLTDFTRRIRPIGSYSWWKRTLRRSLLQYLIVNERALYELEQPPGLL